MAAHQAPIPGILQARILEWVAVSFSSAWKWKVKVKSLSRVLLFMTPWTVGYQAPLSTGFPRQEYWSGLPLPSPFILGSGFNYHNMISVLFCMTQTYSKEKWSGFLAVSILHVVFFELVCNIKMLIGLIKWDLFSTKKKRERKEKWRNWYSQWNVCMVVQVIFSMDNIYLDVWFCFKVSLCTISHIQCITLPGMYGRMGEQNLMTLIKLEWLFTFTTAVGIC